MSIRSFRYTKLTDLQVQKFHHSFKGAKFGFGRRKHIQSGETIYAIKYTKNDDRPYMGISRGGEVLAFRTSIQANVACKILNHWSSQV